MSRTGVISEYLFASIDKKLNELKTRGVDVISFGVGDPDSPPPLALRQKIAELVLAEENHNYSPYIGTLPFREAASRYMERRYGVKMAPASEVVGLIGSKEGIGNCYIAYTTEGDINLVPSLAYPIPKTMTTLMGGTPHILSTPASRGFLMDTDEVDPAVAKKATLLYVNYPNNPTGTAVPSAFYEKTLEFALANDIIIVADAAYEEIYFQEKPRSFFEWPEAKRCVIEFHSLSKMFNITGWRLAFALGSPELLKPMNIMKTNMDSGQFKPIQYAGAFALDTLVDDFGPAQRQTYRSRMKKLQAALESLGAKAPLPGGTFFLWGKTPQGMDSSAFTEFLLEKYGIFVTPGNMFGPEGEGYFRASLTVTDERLDQAVARILK
ncbi:aminotransferase class I/II-fold pyridoxal phosphate-dependent enzyme [Myxococcota bacterium]|nr:aminotransferase class I/II-fold pyridoxal phosphate-dependent enzyme [Myxococcota bacterium]MBU1536552.1 aminotransferase class I/II-fold pyridoxal phosphate-dependent enzyme [Myxococcota bacterium]